MDKAERDELIIQLRREGKTFKEISKEIGCCLKIVRMTIRNYSGDDIRKEQLTTAMTFEDARAKYCPDGFDMLEYHSGQTGGYVRLKCKTCGYEFTKLRTSFCGENGKNKTHCPECDRLEREAKQKQQDKLKRQRERERALEYKNEQLSFNICPVCFGTFQGKRKYCSEECCKWISRKKHKQLRRVRIKSHIVDRDITLNALATRDHNKCWICNRLVDWNDREDIGDYTVVGLNYPSIDHVIPLSKNGLHSWQNVKLAHFGCNRDKGAEILR